MRKVISHVIPFFEKRVDQIIALQFLISLLLLVYANWNGIGYTFDSYDYWNAAQNLSDFFSQNEIESKIINRPPLFPISLAIFTIWSDSGAYLMMFSQFGILSFLFWKLLKEHINEPMMQIFAFGAFAFSIPIHLIHSFLWSESLVMIWAMLTLWILVSPKANERFLLLLLLGCLGVLTKNGYMLTAPGITLVLLLNERNTKGLLKALAYGFTLYLVHYGLTRLSSNMDVHQVLSGVSKRILEISYLNVISGWFLPIKIPLLVRSLALMGLAIFCILWR